MRQLSTSAGAGKSAPMAVAAEPARIGWTVERVLLAAIVLVGFGLRLFRIGEQSLWGDETTSVFRAYGSLGEITEKVRHEGTLPPLYYYLLHFWIRLAGDSERSVRILSLIFGVLAIPLLYVLVRRTLGSRAGVVAAALAALSPFWIYYAQETRTYALVTALVILALYLLLRASDVKNQSTARALGFWLAYTLVAALALYSYYFAGFALAAAVAWLLADRRRWPAVAARCLLAQVGALTLLSPLLVYAGSSLVGEAGSVSRGSVPLSTIVRQLVDTFNLGTTVDPRQVTPFVVVALALAVIGLARSPRRQSLLWGMLLVVPVLAIWEVSFVPHPGWERYFITASPAWYTLVAAGLSALAFGRHPRFYPLTPFSRGNLLSIGDGERGFRSPPLHRRWRGGGGMRPVRLALAAVAGAALLAGFAESLRNYYFDSAYWRNDLRGAERPVEAVATPDVAVIVNGPPQFPSFFYYFHKTVPWFELPAARATGGQTLQTLDDLSHRYRGLWFVKYHPPDYDPDNYVEVWLDQHAYLVSSRWIENLTYGFYATDNPSQPDVVGSAQVGKTFGEDVVLDGYRASRVRAQGGDYLLVTLSWRPLRTPTQSLRVFAHLVDAKGTLVTQSDHFPEVDLRPASTWRAGEVMDDRFGLRLPADYASRGLTLAVGLYHSDGSRLPVPGSADGSLNLPLPGLTRESR